jgi:hypothetical protein
MHTRERSPWRIQSRHRSTQGPRARPWRPKTRPGSAGRPAVEPPHRFPSDFQVGCVYRDDLIARSASIGVRHDDFLSALQDVPQFITRPGRWWGRAAGREQHSDENNCERPGIHERHVKSFREAHECNANGVVVGRPGRISGYSFPRLVPSRRRQSTIDASRREKFVRYDHVTDTARMIRMEVSPGPVHASSMPPAFHGR